MSNADKFHAHLDKCERCMWDHPFDLCAVGAGLLQGSIATEAACQLGAKLRVELLVSEKPRCPHDGGYCHHSCDDKKCFREEGCMSFTTPCEGYPLPGHVFPPVDDPACKHKNKLLLIDRRTLIGTGFSWCQDCGALQNRNTDAVWRLPSGVEK
jgi:hypothetical protein